jgi:hypothetical protein
MGAPAAADRVGARARAADWSRVLIYFLFAGASLGVMVSLRDPAPALLVGAHMLATAVAHGWRERLLARAELVEPSPRATLPESAPAGPDRSEPWRSSSTGSGSSSRTRATSSTTPASR